MSDDKVGQALETLKGYTWNQIADGEFPVDDAPALLQAVGRIVPPAIGVPSRLVAARNLAYHGDREMQADAWLSVCNLIKQLDPDWVERAGTGVECVQQSIRALAKRAASNESEIDGSSFEEFIESAADESAYFNERVVSVVELRKWYSQNGTGET